MAHKRREYGSGRDTNVVTALQELQDREGYLSKEGLMRLCRENKIPGVDIYSVATFYNQFRLSRPAKYKISICKGTACYVKGSEELLKHAESLLGIKAGQTTKDRLIEIEIVRCIGACAKAPAIMINGTVYGLVDKTRLEALIRELK